MTANTLPIQLYPDPPVKPHHSPKNRYAVRTHCPYCGTLQTHVNVYANKMTLVHCPDDEQTGCGKQFGIEIKNVTVYAERFELISADPLS